MQICSQKKYPFTSVPILKQGCILVGYDDVWDANLTLFNPIAYELWNAANKNTVHIWLLIGKKNMRSNEALPLSEKLCLEIILMESLQTHVSKMGWMKFCHNIFLSSYCSWNGEREKKHFNCLHGWYLVSQKQKSLWRVVKQIWKKNNNITRIIRYWGWV